MSKAAYTRVTIFMGPTKLEFLVPKKLEETLAMLDQGMKAGQVQLPVLNTEREQYHILNLRNITFMIAIEHFAHEPLDNRPAAEQPPSN